MMNKIIYSAALAALVACGGGQKSGLSSGGSVPPPPNVPTAGGNGQPVEKREVSQDAKKDYESAATFFATNDKGAWNESTCRSAASNFEAVAREHTDLVEAQFMAGLSYHRCNLSKEAESAYQAATRMKGDPTKIAMALSNLGEIYYKAGKIDGAKQYWESAVKANGKLIAARINLASLELEQMRKIGEKDSNWKKLEEDARFNLSNVLGVDSDSVTAYTVYGLVYMEGWKKNKNRLDSRSFSSTKARSATRSTRRSRTRTACSTCTAALSRSRCSRSRQRSSSTRSSPRRAPTSVSRRSASATTTPRRSSSRR